MFTVNDREHVRERVIEMGRQDSRIAAGAVVGSLAFAEEDRWSDLDLTFAVADGAKVDEVVAAWTTCLLKFAHGSPARCLLHSSATLFWPRSMLSLRA